MAEILARRSKGAGHFVQAAMAAFFPIATCGCSVVLRAYAFYPTVPS
jgi:hypothetical protein